MGRLALFAGVLLVVVIGAAVLWDSPIARNAWPESDRDLRVFTHLRSQSTPQRISECLTSERAGGENSPFRRVSIASAYGGPKDSVILSEQGVRVSIDEAVDGSILRVSSKGRIGAAEAKRIKTCASLGY